MPELAKSGSAGAAGGQLPAATYPPFKELRSNIYSKYICNLLLRSFPFRIRLDCSLPHFQRIVIWHLPSVILYSLLRSHIFNLLMGSLL